MCGILGCIDVLNSFDASDYATFRRLTDVVQHRGPNASGSISYLVQNGSAESSADRFNVFFGFRRLSILDLSDVANQPLTTDGKTWIIFNGEIFNFIELRQELEAQGCVFQTSGDTEVLLQLYNRCGPDAFHKLNGMWALAILDIERRRIVLSRDRFSIKPLYLLEAGSRLYFASEIKQLVPLLPSVRLNEGTMAAYLHQSLLDNCEDTFYRGIRRFPPRHNFSISLTDGKVDAKPYWDFPRTAASDVSLEDAIVRFRELLVDSIRIRLRSDVSVGALISGGLDSSAIAVIADKLRPGLETHAGVSKTAEYSEEKHIDLLLNSYRLNNRKHSFELDEALSIVDHVTYQNDEPLGSFSAVAHHLIMRHIRQETDLIVILSGQGGDEVLLGYLRFFFFWVRQLLRDGRHARAASELIGSLWNGTCVRQFELSKARAYLPSVVGRYKGPTYLKVPVESDEQVWRIEGMHERQIYEIESYSVPQLTQYEDRNSMAYSLEIRLPFLDHRLVEFAMTLPVEMLVKSGWTKYILRQALPELPDGIRWRKDKQGFLTPERKWLNHELVPTIRNMFQGSVLDRMGMIDDDAYLAYYDRFRAGDRNIGQSDIVRVFLAEIWARQAFAPDAAYQPAHVPVKA